MNGFETHVQDEGQKLLGLAKSYEPTWRHWEYWHTQILSFVMSDPALKVQLFHLVDVLPTLSHPAQVSKHVKEYISSQTLSSPWLSLAFRLLSLNATSYMTSPLLKKQIAQMAQRFIMSHDPDLALVHIRRLYRQGFLVTADLLGEATLSEAEALVYLKRYQTLIGKLSYESLQWPDNPILDQNHVGSIPKANVSLKLSALEPNLSHLCPEKGAERLYNRLLPLFLQAKAQNVFLNIDLEQWTLHELTYTFFERIALHPELRQWPHLGIVVQGYLKHSKTHLELLIDLAKKRQMPLTVRLVKGAYWDFETVYAKQNGFPTPVFEHKSQTDAHYEFLTTFLLENHEYLWPALATHNVRSIAYAIQCAKSLGLPLGLLEFQMLYGMAAYEQEPLKAGHHRLRLYAPIGELLPGMAYLVRRLLENTSNQGFLKLAKEGSLPMEELLQNPAEKPLKGALPQAPKKHLFQVCAALDFTNPSIRSSLADWVREIESKAPYQVIPSIKNQDVLSRPTFEHLNPSHKDRVVSRVELASLEDAKEAVKVAYGAFDAWRSTPLLQRTECLERLGSILERDRLFFTALLSVEVGKNWADADGEVAEAVDYCRYYAWLALEELSPKNLSFVLGEENQLVYEGRGPSVVIAPWNFPLAILCGMAVGALVAGNTVILKPAEQSSLVAFELYKRMLEAGFSKEVVHLLPGIGEDVGPYLVEHPKVAQIAFTGSKAVGHDIVRRAGMLQFHQEQMKRVVCEMGGKNAIIVDDDADVDEALTGILQSAFGYAGQKCSACSRVILVGSIGDVLVPRLLQAAKSWPVGPSMDPQYKLGPVIDEVAQNRLRHEIAQAKTTAKLLYEGQKREEGFYVPLCIFEVDDLGHRLMQEELFGPILAIYRATSFDEALEAAAKTQFALTGAIYTRLPSHVEKAKKAFRVGNLYINRGCTGAVVERQPFGGFKMSGFGNKAGGPGYLLHFSDLRCITENTMRRGFTPELV